MPTESKSETPRTDACPKSIGFLSIEMAKMEKELNEAKRYELQRDKDVDSILKEREQLIEERNTLAKQFEESKRELAHHIELRELAHKGRDEFAKENKVMREALGIIKELQYDEGSLARKIAHTALVDAGNTTNLIVLTRNELIAEIEKIPCWCNKAVTSFVYQCRRCQWLARVKGQ